MDDRIYSELWLYWVQISVRHAKAAAEWRVKSTAEPSVMGPDRHQATFEEVPSSTAVAAAAFAVDAFDQAVADFVKQPLVRESRAKAVLQRLGARVHPPARGPLSHRCRADLGLQNTQSDSPR